MAIKIMLDPGHGYGREYNRGSLIGNEGDNNWAYSQVLKKALEGRGFVVGLTRSEKTDPSLKARGNAADGYDLFISLHSNAASADVRGTEIWNDVNDGFPDASGLCAAIARAFGHKNRGVKLRRNASGGNWYGVLRANRAKAGMLIEHGFHTNRLDCSYYVNHRKELAEVTAEYLAKYYGVKAQTQACFVPEQPAKLTAKSIEAIADEVIAGKWGNGDERKRRLNDAGYDYDAVQQRVNDKLGIGGGKKSIDAIADEVINGDWGNGEARKRRLQDAGYDYGAVQKRVNEKL